MPKYQCPECEAVLKRAAPVEEGKKIKCPKCEVIFKAKAILDPEEAAVQAKQKAKTADKKAAAAGDDDEEVGGFYGVAEEKKEEAADVRANEINFGNIRDKFPKSKRGPAIGKVVKPSSLILMAGAFTAILAIVYLGWGLWPFIFSDAPPRGKDLTYRIIHIVAAVVSFCCNGLVCHGASKMHTLESYNWAMTASIMCILFSIAPLGLGAGIFGIITLQDEEVVAGFKETASKKDDDY